MSEIRYPPDDPREWLNRARSSLNRARQKSAGIYLEDLCFDAQQAAEKAIKAVLICHRLSFPYVHDRGELLTLAQRVEDLTPALKQAARLTRYAVMGRYPTVAEPVAREEYEAVVAIAAAVVSWAEKTVHGRAAPQ